MKNKNAVYVMTILIICFLVLASGGNAFSAQQPDFKVVAGKWARTDGNYQLSVSNVTAEGTADVGYFNPGSIHVEESRIDTQGGLVRLFVKLQDKGYPGSTYTLYYYAAKDALAGFYYQAALNRQFEVVFIRK